MIRYIAILLLSSICAAMANTAHVHIIAGQSNARGKPYVYSVWDYRGYDEHQTNVLWHYESYYSANPTREAWWWDLQAHTNVEWGAELEFGRRWTSTTQDQLAILKTAKGSTSIAYDWVPYASEMWTALTNDWHASTTSLVALGYTPVLESVLWVQGEQDAKTNESASIAYGDNLTNLITQARSVIGLCPWYLAELPVKLRTDNFPYQAGVRSGQIFAASALADVHLLQMDGYDLGSDEVHYDETSLLRLGDLWFSEAVHRPAHTVVIIR